jgi:hypothetical protein
VDISPAAAIGQYARTIAHGGTTHGEKGILISLNLRWLPYFVSLRQALGMEPLRIRFAPTSHEPLAQSPGRNTFAFDPEGHLWQVLGQTEAGAEVGPDGLKADRPVSLSLKTLRGDTHCGDGIEVRPQARATTIASLTLHCSAGKAH